MESSRENYHFKCKLESYLEETRREIKSFKDVPQPMEPTRGHFLNLAQNKESLLTTLLKWKESLEKIFSIGTLITVINLKNKPELNHKRGIITKFNVSTERCLIKMEQGLGEFNFKPVNLLGLSPKWESQYQQVIEYLQQYNLQITSYIQFRDKIIEKYKIPGIPPISERKNLQAKHETINTQLEQLQEMNTHGNSLDLNKQFLSNLEKHNRACYYLMSMNENLKKKTQIKTFFKSVEDQILNQLENLELDNLMVSYPSYNRCVTLINMKVIHQLLKEEDKEGQELSQNTIQGEEIPKIVMEELETGNKLMTPSLAQKNLETKSCLDQASLKCIQKCILSWYLRFKFRYLKINLGYHIKKALSEIKFLREQIIMDKSIKVELIKIHKIKHMLLISFIQKILDGSNSKQKISSLKSDLLFSELIEYRKGFLEKYNFPVIEMNPSKKFLSLEIQQTQNKLMSLYKTISHVPRTILEIAILEKKKFYYLEKKRLTIKNQILIQQNIRKWSNVEEDYLSYQQTVLRAFDCLEIEDLRISSQACQLQIALTYIQNKETLLNLVIQENTNSLLVEQEKVPSKKSRKKKKKKKLTSFNINTLREDVNIIKIDFTKYKKIAFTRWTQYFNLVKAIITIQSLFRKNISQYRYQKIRLKIIGFQSRVRKRLHWVKIKQPQSYPSEKSKSLNSKQRRQFRRQQRRVISLEAEVDDFFQSRYQEELKKLLSGQMDTTPTLGLRVPYEIQSRKCDGVPEGFIPQNNF